MPVSRRKGGTRKGQRTQSEPFQIYNGEQSKGHSVWETQHRACDPEMLDIIDVCGDDLRGEEDECNEADRVGPVKTPFVFQEVGENTFDKIS